MALVAEKDTGSSNTPAAVNNNTSDTALNFEFASVTAAPPQAPVLL
jgi:hypothetical protein